MNWCPQIGGGSIAQFPLHRQRKWRTIANELENGARVALPDPAAGKLEWRLSYRDLSDEEATRLQTLFVASKGSYGSFGFADPLANLLAWSEDLTKPDWQAGLLSVTAGAADPFGTHTAWTVSNASPAIQALSQTVGIPGEYVACFSLWIRAAVSGAVTLQRDGVTAEAAAGPAWKRLFISSPGNAGTTNAVVSLQLNAGQTLEIWGPQLEAQPYASQYKPTTVPGGLYPETRFATDELTMTSTGVGLTDCEITLVSRI
jgi:hypothetical protein